MKGRGVEMIPLLQLKILQSNSSSCTFIHGWWVYDIIPVEKETKSTRNFYVRIAVAVIFWDLETKMLMGIYDPIII